MKKKALIVVNLAGFLHFLWNDIATLQEMGYEVSVAMNENSAAGPNLIEIPKLEEMGIAHYQVEFDTKSPVSTQNIQAYKQLDVYKRQVLDAALGIPAELPAPPYIQVLGARKTALSRLKQAALPAGTSLACLLYTSRCV